MFGVDDQWGSMSVGLNTADKGTLQKRSTFIAVEDQ